MHLNFDSKKKSYQLDLCPEHFQVSQNQQLRRDPRKLPQRYFLRGIALSIMVDYLRIYAFSVSRWELCFLYIVNTWGCRELGSQEFWLWELFSLSPVCIEAQKYCQCSPQGNKSVENQQWEAPFLLPAKLPSAFEIILGQIKWKMMQEQVLRVGYRLW